MKLLIAFALVVLAVYSIDACTHHDDCNSYGSSCPTGHFTCILRQCHCTMGSTGDSCTDSGDCPDCHDRFLSKHCVDGGCRCTIHLGGIGGIGK
ncbi:tenascin-like [Ruditapes philippinarum]|uniref:tenascin-like n=1 Tax=Ruditapes philippinarum TaxID=129788 RepID=UPI00295BCD9A|nr:tenascin-like [Ruditapes philippinarum]